MERLLSPILPSIFLYLHFSKPNITVVFYSFTEVSFQSRLYLFFLSAVISSTKCNKTIPADLGLQFLVTIWDEKSLNKSDASLQVTLNYFYILDFQEKPDSGT
jgi:hypothetical protein